MERLTKRLADGTAYTGALINASIKGVTYPTYIGKAADKLAAYEDAEEQGLLLRLPCKVGDTVYSLDRFCGGYSSDCPSRPCKDCPDYKLEIHEEKFKLNNIYDFDKTVFLTQEKAEAKRKEMEGSHE